MFILIEIRIFRQISNLDRYPHIGTNLQNFKQIRERKEAVPQPALKKQGAHQTGERYGRPLLNHRLCGAHTVQSSQPPDL